MVSDSVPLVGMWVRAPGCEDIMEMAENVLINRHNMSPIPEVRQDLAEILRIYPTIKADLVDGIEYFDNEYFAISDSEAICMDPQQRLLLEGVVLALENAGITLEMLSHYHTSVFTSAWTYDYKDLLPAEEYMIANNPASVICGRISHFLNLRGASVGVETACSNSLVALHLARLSILSGESQFAIVCGANYIGSRSFKTLYQSHVLSPDGRLASFDSDTNESSRSESFAVAILVSQSFALQQNLRIRCWITGSAYSNDGKIAQTALNAISKREVQALAMESIDPSTIEVVVCHDIGTKVTDRVELMTINQSFPLTVKIIAPKFSLGHGESAAGLIGLFYSVFLMEKNILPDQLEVSLPIDLMKGNSLTIICEEKDEVHRIAINSYDLEKSACIITNPPIKTQFKKPVEVLNILLFSTTNKESLEKQIDNYAKYLELSSEDLIDILHSTNYRRPHYDVRAAVFGRNRTEIISKIRAGDIIHEVPVENFHIEFGSNTASLKCFRRFCAFSEVFIKSLKKNSKLALECGVVDAMNAVFLPFQTIFPRLTECVAELLVAIAQCDMLEDYNALPTFVGGKGIGHIYALAVAQAISVVDAILLIKCVITKGDIRSAVNKTNLRIPRCSIMMEKSISKRINHKEITTLISSTQSDSSDLMKFYIGAEELILRDGDPICQLESLLCYLFVMGYDIRINLYGQIVNIPAYPFLKKRFWPETSNFLINEESNTMGVKKNRKCWNEDEIIEAIRSIVWKFVFDIIDDGDIILKTAQLDSSTAIEIIKDIRSVFNVQIPTDILDSSSIRSLTKSISSELHSLPMNQDILLQKGQNKQVGIISADFCFPGGADSFEELWDALLTGKHMTKPMNDLRIKQIQANLNYQIGLLNGDISLFDNEFFEISEDDANFIDPQHRILLQCAYNAHEKCGFPSLENCNLYVAVSTNSEYQMLIEKNVSDLDSRLFIGTSHSMLAGRLAKLLGVKGRAMVVDTACSSVASAIEMCLGAMNYEDLDYGVIATTQLVQSTRWIDALKSLLSSDFTKSFSENSEGFIRSETVGVLILKKLQTYDSPLILLSDAKTQYCGAVLTPMISSISALIDKTGDIDYLEGHGAGTAFGDNTESIAYSGKFNDIILSSIKAQFGHSETASGLMQICKVIQMMKMSTVPAIAHNFLPNEHIRLNPSLRLPYVTEEKYIVNSGIISCGITGTNAAIRVHQPQFVKHCEDSIYHILPISAKTERDLHIYINLLIDMIYNTDHSLRDISLALQHQKSSHKWRTAVVACSHKQAVNNLKLQLSGPKSQNLESRLSIPTTILHSTSFFDASAEFRMFYETCCAKFYFTSYSNPKSKYHQFAVAYATLKYVLLSGIQVESLSATGIDVLVCVAVLNAAQSLCISDLVHAFLNEDVRLMRCITRDLHINFNLPLWNGNGCLVLTADHLIDSCFIKEFNHNATFPSGTLFIGSPLFDTKKLLSYNEFLTALCMNYKQGNPVNWSRFGTYSNIVKLPKYPFQKKSFLIPQEICSSKPTTNLVMCNSPEERSNVANFNSSKWIHVKNQLVNGKVIVPSTTLLPMISQVNKSRSIFLSNIDFLIPIIPRAQMVIVKNNSRNRQILSCNNFDVISYSLTEESCTPIQSVSPFPAPLKSYTSAEVTDRFSHNTLMYKHEFQMISSVYSSCGKGVAYFKPIDKIDILVETSFQCILIGYLFEVLNDQNTYLPFKIEAVHIYTTVLQEQNFVAYFTYIIEDEFLVGDVTIYDKNRIVIDIKSACFLKNKLDINFSTGIPVTKQINSDSLEFLRHKTNRIISKWFEDFCAWIDVDENADFFELGISSLQATELVNYLKKYYANISATSVIAYSTISKLTEHLISLENIHPQEDTEKKTEHKEMPLLHSTPFPVGVMAGSCRLPGGINDMHEFWNHLKTGINLSTRTPISRIPSRDVLIKGIKYGTPVEGGNFILQDVADFDHSFFKISKSEAEMIDPQQRLLLECVQECIENAGITDLSNVGVFVGLMEKEYTELMDKNTNILSMLGSMAAVIAGRINYVFGSHGPSVTIDTACSSSLVAVEIAINAILDGRCSYAIVAGVNLILHEKGQGMRANGKMLSVHGMSMSFDADASGYGRSDGCVVIMIEKARPSFSYLAKFCGININHGGRSTSLTAPNGIAHKLLLSSLLQNSSNQEVQYWEAHGTGTPIGDPIEINTLSSVLEDIVVSSVKSSVGHGEASAGTCGLLKLALMFQNDYIPASIHLHKVNNNINCKSLRFPVVGEDLTLNVGGISSFGVSGTNAAAILHKSEIVPKQPQTFRRLYLVLFSAKNQKSLLILEKEMEEVLKQSSESIDDIIGALCNHRIHYEHRYIAVVNRKGEQLKKFIGEYKRNEHNKVIINVANYDLNFDLLQIQTISEYFYSVKSYSMSLGDKLMYALLKFFYNVFGHDAIDIRPKSPHALILAFIASGNLELSYRTSQLIFSVTTENIEKELLDFEITSMNNPTFKLALDYFRNMSSVISLNENSIKCPNGECLFLSNHLDLLFIIGKLYISGIDMDLSFLYGSPEKYVHLPTHPFNRKSLWFTDRPKLYEHYLLGSIAEQSPSITSFQNQLSEIRHSQFFKGVPIDIGTVIEIVNAAIQIQGIHAIFKMTNIEISEIILSKSTWLVTNIEKNGQNFIVEAYVDGIKLFRCIVQIMSESPTVYKNSDVGFKRNVFLAEVPNLLVKISDNLHSAIIDSTNESSPYRCLAAVLTLMNGTIPLDFVESFSTLEKIFHIFRKDIEGRILFEVHSPNKIVLKLTFMEVKSEQSEGTSEILYNIKSISSVNKSESTIVRRQEENKIIEKVRTAFNDSNNSGLMVEDEQLEIGFMELGMDSLSMVTFISNLTEKYFPGLEITTADVFNFPNIINLSRRINSLLNSESVKSSEETSNSMLSPKETKHTLAYVYEKVISALLDTMNDGLNNDLSTNDQSFMELGMDSLSLVDFVNRLNVKYFPLIELSSSDIFDYPTTSLLSQYIYAQMEQLNSSSAESTISGKRNGSSIEALNGFDNHSEIVLAPSTIHFVNEYESSIITKVINAVHDISTEDIKFNNETLMVGFMELGLDSLSVVDFVNRLNEKYFPDLEISSMDIFNHPSIRELANHILEMSTTQRRHDVSKKKKPNEINDDWNDIFQLYREYINNDSNFGLHYKDNEHLSLNNNKNSEELIWGTKKSVIFETELSNFIFNNATIMVDLSVDLVMETLFLLLLNFCRALIGIKKPVVISVSSRRTLGNAIACSFFKTVAAEKYPLIKYVWNERIQRIKISLEELDETITGNWLITGGISGIGLAVAKWLVMDCHISAIVLISRRIPSEEVEKELDIMRSKANVITASINITDQAAMKALFSSFNFKINGVIHSAGILQDGIIERQSQITFNSVFLPKGIGYEVLDNVLNEFNHCVESFIVMSSFSSAFGNFGQLNYAVANSYLDYQMHQRRRRGKTGTTVLWGNWLDTGMAIDVNDILSNFGFIGLRNKEALQYLKFAILKKPEQIIVAKLNWEILLRKRPDIRVDLIKEGEINYADLEGIIDVMAGDNTIYPNENNTGGHSTMDNFPSNIFKQLPKVPVFESNRKSDTEKEDGYCNRLGINVFYNNEGDFSTSVDLHINSFTQKNTMNPTVKRGKFVQHVVGSSIAEVKAKLKALKFSDSSKCREGKTALMFPGQGAQYPLMGRQLCDLFPLFRREFNYCVSEADKILKGKIPLLEILQNPDYFHELLVTSHMQPIMLAFGIASARLWESFGFHPDFYVGHSVGEIVAGIMAGIMTIDDGIRLVVARGVSMEKIAGRGALLAIDRRIADYVMENYEISTAIINSPQQIVVAGTKDELDKVIRMMKSKKMHAAYVNVEYPFHSSFIYEEDLADLRKVLKTITFNHAHTPIVSNVSGKVIYSFTEDYIVKHVVSPVMFVSCVETLFEQGVTTWVEAGPCSTLGLYVKKILPLSELENHAILQTAKDRDEDVDCVIMTALELEKRNISINWPAVYDYNLGHKENENYLLSLPIKETYIIGEMEERVLNDHRINGKNVVAGTFQVYKLLKWINIDSSESNYFTLKNAKFMNPWYLNKTAYDLLRNHENNLKILVNEENVCTSYCHLNTTQFTSIFNIEEHDRKCPMDCDVNKFYGDIIANGMEYGRHFQTIKSLRMSHSSTFATLETKKPYFLWTLMDAALHVVCLNIISRRPGIYFIPIFMGEVYVNESVNLEMAKSILVLADIISENEKFIQVNSCLIVDGIVAFESRNMLSILLKAQSTSTHGKYPLAHISNDRHSSTTSNSLLQDETMLKDFQLSDEATSNAETQLIEKKKANNYVQVVGYDCKFCFGASNNIELWQLLKAGITYNKYQHRCNLSNDVSLIDLDITTWDPEYFGISPKEASYMDPQQRLIMQSVVYAMENAGINQLPKSTGIFIGVSGHEFTHRVYEEMKQNRNGYVATGTHGSCIAGRIAHWLKVEGPVMVIDTACSSSFSALTTACDSLINGRCTFAIVGGINLILHNTITEVLNNAGMLSSSQRCQVFDADADGYRRSEGVVTILLSNLEHYMPIAKLTSWALNHNGVSGGLQVPNGSSQERIMRQVLENSCTMHVECHGTGTSLGDPIEVHAISRLHGTGIISSIKSQLGHTEAVSGMASLISSLLQLQHGYRLQQMHLKCPNPKVSFGNLVVNCVANEEEISDIMINNFGFSGTNGVILVEKSKNRTEKDSFQMILNLAVISAKNKESLDKMITEFKSFVELSDEMLHHICTKLQRGMLHYKYRHAILFDHKRKIIWENGQSQKDIENVREGIFESKKYEDMTNEEVSVYFGSGFASYILKGFQNNAAEIFMEVLSGQFHEEYISDIQNPIGFHKSIGRMYCSGINIDWSAFNIDKHVPPALIPNYQFYTKPCWPFKSEFPNNCVESATIDNIYFTKQLVEVSHSVRDSSLCVFTLDDYYYSNFVRYLSEDNIPRWIQSNIPWILLFHPTDSSTEQALKLINTWKLLINSKSCLILIACKSNETSFCEWTALIRTLASEQLLSYKFVSYTTIAQLESELTLSDVFESIFYVNQLRFVERLVKVQPSNGAPPRPNHLLISGGTGGIGQKIIEYLVPMKTTILSRSVNIPQTQKISFMHVDISSQPISVNGLCRPDFIVHCAGTVDNGLMHDMNGAKFSNVLQPKVVGLQSLIEVAKKLNVKNIVVASSAAAILGSVGQANYAFANGLMTSIAEKSSIKIQVIHWGPWKDTGMLSGEKLLSLRKQITMNGWNFLSVDQGLEAITTQNSNVMIFKGDFEQIIRKQKHLRNFLENVVSSKLDKFPIDKTTLFEQHEMPNESRNPTEVIEMIIKTVSGIEDIKENSTIAFMNLGIDSLMIEEIRTKILDHFGIQLSSPEIYDNSTVATLSNLVAEKISQNINKKAKIINTLSLDKYSSNNDIAIIAFSGSFSGSPNVDEFWANLLNKKECISRDSSAFKNNYVQSAGIIKNIEEFDHKFWKISIDEAAMLDPQIRTFVQHAYHALEKSGYIRTRSEMKIGVYAGAEPSEYSDPKEYAEGSLHRMFAMNMKDFVATYTAYLLNIRGVALGIYSACSTSLLAIIEASNALRLSRIDMAVVGAVSLVLPHQIGYEYEEGLAFSQTGECRPFDIEANGTVRGSSVGCIILKRMDKAIEDGDHIEAIIKSYGMSNDGLHKASFMAPNSKGQSQCIEEALKGLNPDEVRRIRYVECHGTGTAVGDEIELQALKNNYTERNDIYIGSVKANIGHGFAAGGIASLFKAIRILKEKIIPPQINFRSFKPEVNSPFKISTTSVPIDHNSLIAVSSFGIGGTNAHMIIGNSTVKTSLPNSSNLKYVILPISANSEESCMLMCRALAEYLSKCTAEDLPKIASTLQRNREVFKYRIAFAVSSPSEAVTKLMKVSKPSSVEGLDNSNICFFFSPQGVQYENMERCSLSEESVFKRELYRLIDIASSMFKCNFMHIMYPQNGKSELIMQAKYAQVIVFILCRAVLAQLENWGLSSDLLIGHSVGEYTAASYCGIIDEIECMRLLKLRGELVSQTKPAKMLAVRGQDLNFPEEVEISAVLSESLRCIVGTKPSVEALQTYLDMQKIEYRELETSYGFHSSMMDSVQTQFRDFLDLIEFKAGSKKIISNVDGKIISTLSTDYCSRHMRHPVRLDKCIDLILRDQSIKAFVQIGPPGILENILAEKKSNVKVINTVLSKRQAGQNPNQCQLLQALADLWSLGFDVKFDKIFPNCGFEPEVPGYQFDPTVCWINKLPVREKETFFGVTWSPLNSSHYQRNIRDKSIIIIAYCKNDLICEFISLQLTNSILVIEPKEIIEVSTNEWISTDLILFILENNNFPSFEPLFITQNICSNVLRQSKAKLMVISLSNDPLHWMVIGPIREYHIGRKKRNCFVDNRARVPIAKIVSSLLDSFNEVVLVTPHCMMMQDYSESLKGTEMIFGRNVIVFGGTGSVGKAYIDVILEYPNVDNILICSRKINKDPRQILKGKRISYVNVDVTDNTSVAEFLAYTFNELKSINTIIHAAGIPTSASFIKSKSDIISVLKPKITGTLNIINALIELNISIDNLIMVSSLSSVLAIQGSEDYSAANLFMDSLAMNGHPRINNIQAVQWPAWKDAGMFKSYAPSAINELINRNAISTQKGKSAIKESLFYRGSIAYSSIHPLRLRSMIEKTQLGHASDVSNTIDATQPSKKQLVMNIWRETLSTNVTSNSNFFDLGGNSLTALQVIWKINRLINSNTTVNILFEHPILDDFVEHLTVGSCKDYTSFDALSQFPLSYAQENMYLLKQLEVGPQYNIIFSITLKFKDERFSFTSLVNSINSMIARQHCLRSIFLQSDKSFKPYQEVLSLTECYQNVNCQKIEASKFNGIIREEMEFEFHLHKIPLRIRWLLIDQDYVIIFNQHHILTDGWSMTVLAKEITSLYSKYILSNTSNIEPIKSSLCDYAQYQQKSLNFTAEIDELKDMLTNKKATQIPADTLTSSRGLPIYKKCQQVIPCKIASNIKLLAKEHHTTDFVITLSAYILTIRKWKMDFDEDEIIIGCPVAGRSENVKNLIGYFLNNIIIYVEVQTNHTLIEVIPLIESAVLNSRRFENVPFHKLVAALKIQREPHQHPVFQLYFNYRHTLDFPVIEIPGATVLVDQLSMNTTYNLSVTLDETPEGMRVLFEYNSSMYYEETILAIMADFLCILGERHNYEKVIRGPYYDIPQMSLVKQIVLQLEMSKDDEALKGTDFSVSYSTLRFILANYTAWIINESAKNTGCLLRSDDVIVIDMSPNDSVIPILAVLLTGAAYAPIDPSWPDAKKKSIISNVHGSLVLSQKVHKDISAMVYKESTKLTRILNKNYVYDIIYIIHTSGSTGQPKGVAVSHDNVNSLLCGMTRSTLMRPRHVVFHSVNTVFDVSVVNVIGSVVNGSKLYLHDDLRNIPCEISAKKCDFTFLTSATFNSLRYQDIQHLACVEKLFVGGESIHDRNLLSALNLGIHVTQIYGPTEGTVWSLTERCKAIEGVGTVIGKPVPNEVCWIADKLPQGELVLSGSKVARGYIGGCVDEKFKIINGKRCYYTGDFVKEQCGTFSYKGRLDNQVKIRGYRIETTEIEKTILMISKQIESTVVTKCDDVLVAFIVSDDTIVTSLLSYHLSAYVPSYSLPSHYVQISTIPYSSNGKINKEVLLHEFRRMMNCIPRRVKADSNYIVTSIEGHLIRIFQKVLQIENVCVNDNFFSLGGHSLLLFTLKQEISENLNSDIEIHEIFANPVLKNLAKVIVIKLKESYHNTDTSIITKLRESPSPKFNIYLIHPIGGTIFQYHSFLKIFPKDVSIYAIEYQLEYKPHTLKELAAFYGKAIAVHTGSIQPFLMGHSMGGTISREMAPELKMWGYEVPFVVLFDSWVVSPEQLSIKKVEEFARNVFAHLPNSDLLVERALKLAEILRSHHITQSDTKIYLFKSRELGNATTAVRFGLTEVMSRAITANGFDHISTQPVHTWLIRGDHESCLKTENLCEVKEEILSLFKKWM